MREILFRGKTEKAEWVEGYFCPCSFGRFPCKPAIISTDKLERGAWEPFAVDLATVGQYTGLTDKDGKKIFEGDILAHFINYLGKRFNGVVRYDSKIACWICDFYNDENKESAFLADWLYKKGAKIIGNIHDNPELLEAKP